MSVGGPQPDIAHGRGSQFLTPDDLEPLPDFPEPRSDREILISIADLLEAHLAELKHIAVALRSSSDSRSSAEIKTSTRGYDIAAKAYEGSPTDGLVDAALDMYGEMVRKAKQRSDENWVATVDA